MPVLSDPGKSANIFPGASLHRFPDFLCIGAQKAGTTWLYENIRRHPKIWLPPVKELQYFNELYIPDHRKWTPTHRRTHGSRVLQQYLKQTGEDDWDYRFIARTADIVAGTPSDEWYGNIFTLAGDDQVCGEMTPEYSTLPQAGIEHILRLMPQIKIIFSMRDPIERSWSHLRMLARNSSTSDVAALVELATYPDIAERGDYPKILSLWSGLNPPERLHLLFMDDIASRPVEVMQGLCSFLGIEYQEGFFPHLSTAVHVGDDVPLPPELHEFLKRQMRPVFERLEPRFPEIVGQWLARHYGR
jgi:hypothetical protein